MEFSSLPQQSLLLNIIYEHLEKTFGQRKLAVSFKKAVSKPSSCCWKVLKLRMLRWLNSWLFTAQAKSWSWLSSSGHKSGGQVIAKSAIYSMYQYHCFHCSVSWPFYSLVPMLALVVASPGLFTGFYQVIAVTSRYYTGLVTLQQSFTFV